MFRLRPADILAVALCAALSFSCGRTGSTETVDSGDPKIVDDGGQITPDSGHPVDAGELPDSGVSDAGRPDAGTFDAGTPGSSHTLSVMTINLWHDFPNFSNLEPRTQAVADFIKQQQPDLVAAQEAGENGLIKNRCKVIAEKAGYQYRWVSEGGFTAIFAEGPCVLSRWPIIDDKKVDLPHPQQSGLVIRKALAVRVQHPAGQLTMVSTHLSNGGDMGTQRLDQAVKAYGLVKEYEGALPVFLGGDLNSDPMSDAMKFLRGEMPMGGVTSKTRDLWLEARPNDPGLTASADGPDQRIDYLYYLPGSTALTRVHDCEVVLNQKVNGIYPSDHYGVQCKLDVTLPPN